MTLLITQAVLGSALASNILEPSSYSELECRWIVLLLCNTIWTKISTTHDLIDCPGCIGLRSSSVSTHGTMINDIIDRPGCIGVGIGVQHFGTIFILKAKVIHPKYSKHWPYTLAHTIDCVCSKMLNHGLNHGLFLSLFKLILCPIHWIVYVLAYLDFIFEF